MTDRGDELTLAIDASTYVGTVAVVRGTRLLAAGDAAMRGRDEERLMPAVVATLERAGVEPRELTRIVCGAGPGSFTSLRIAGAIAKGMAVALDRPLYAVSTSALILFADRVPTAGRYLVLIDAMRGDVYATRVDVDGDGMVIVSDTTVMPAAGAIALALDEGRALAGPAAPDAADSAPHARALAHAAVQALLGAPVDLDVWEPAYGRLAEAQVKWEAAHGRPLAAQ